MTEVMAQKFTVPITIKQLSSPSSDGLTIYLDGETFSRLQVQAGGRLVWGDGLNAPDTNLYRDAANVLKTDDTFKVPTLFVDNIEIDTTGANNGLVLMFDGTKFSPSTMPGGEPMGISNRTESTISFNKTTRVFTIAPVGASFEVWCKGKRYIKDTAKVLTLPNTSGLYYIYFDSTGTLQYKTSFFDFENETPVAYVYWNAADSQHYFFADERHGVVLDWQTHEYLHRTRGAAYASGFGIGAYSTTGDGTNNSDMEFDIANGTFFDEDLQVDITHSASPTTNTWEQMLQGGAEIPVFYRSGSVWKHTTPTKYAVKQGTLPQYNLNTGGTWTTPDMTTNFYGVTWICATNNLNYPVIGIMGQNEYPNLNKVAEDGYSSLNLTGLPIFEIRPLYKIAFLTSATFTNTPKAAIRQVIDIRTISDTLGLASATPVSDHGSMLGLTDDDHPQYVHVDQNRQITAVHNFNNGLSSSGPINTASLYVDGIEVDTTGATNLQALVFDGTKFAPSTLVGPTGPTGAIGPTGPQSTVTGPTGPLGPTGPTESASVANVMYVSKSGNDANDGTSLAKSKLTIKSALSVATADTTIFVKSGDYTEINPVTVPAKVSIVGDSARAVTVRPLNTTSDIFYVNNASYITGITFRDHVSPAAAIAFNPDGSAGNITQSPYVFDCSSLTTTGTGMRVDGSVVGGGKSMLAGQFTQINLGGKGIHLLNRGYAQLIAIYTICCDVSVLCESGGFCSLIGSDTSFGNYGLKASGVSELLYSGTASAAPFGATSVTVNNLTSAFVNVLPHTPYVNNVVTFDDGATYYSIIDVTPISSGSSTLTLDQRLQSPVALNDVTKFYQASKITASNHTFEFCGSGIDLINARPQFGGIPIQENEIIQEFGGQVFYTSTDHKGDFRIGSELKIDRGSGAIEGIAFDRSIFATITPYILAIEG